MQEQIDFATLTNEQLIHLVQVRGQALSMHHAADHVMLEKLDSGTLEANDIKKIRHRQEQNPSRIDHSRRADYFRSTEFSGELTLIRDSFLRH